MSAGFFIYCIFSTVLDILFFSTNFVILFKTFYISKHYISNKKCNVRENHLLWLKKNMN